MGLISLQKLSCLLVVVLISLIFSYSLIQDVDANNNNDKPPVRWEVPKTFDYGEYVERYRKSYTPVETMERAKYFFGRTLGIFKHNLLFVSSKVGHFLKQTEYTDMTPKETKEIFRLEDTGFAPVQEASMDPNLAADDLWSVAKLKARDQDDQEGLSTSAAVNSPVEFRKPVVNFLEESDDVETDGGSDLLAQLTKQKLGKRARAQLMSLSSTSNNLVQPEEDVSEKARRLRGIKFRPVVERNNENYDPSVIPSQGIMDNMEVFSENYAKMMMDDFTADLAPYPAPKAPLRKVLTTGNNKDDDNDDTKTSKLSSLMKSVKTFYDYFTYDDVYPFTDDEDGDDDENDSDGDKKDDYVQVEKPSEEEIKPKSNVVEYDIDWRRSGCISRPRSQAKCNSCYAFATLDLMEFFYCRQKKTYTEFSVQYVIDCGSKAKLNGCTGGKLSHVGLFIQKYGIQLESFYPYRGLENTCPFDDSEFARQAPYPLKPTLKAWRMFQEMTAWYKWLPKSPTIVGISMPGDFLAYGGGIHDGSDCVPGMVHAMLLVGSGTQDGHPFWLLKNTFSDSWGEEGYFRLSKRAPLKCFNSVVVARVNFDVQAS